MAKVKFTIFYIGGGLDSGTLFDIIKGIIVENEFQFIESPEGLELYRRHLNEEDWLFINNHTDNEILIDNHKIEAFGSKIIKRQTVKLQRN